MGRYDLRKAFLSDTSAIHISAVHWNCCFDRFCTFKGICLYNGLYPYSEFAINTVVKEMTPDSRIKSVVHRAPPYPTQLSFKCVGVALTHDNPCCRVNRVRRGPSIKYVTLEGVLEGVTVCDRGKGSRACDVTFIHVLLFI